MVQVFAALIFINLLLWLIFFIKFKRLFTTEKIMQKFQTGMEQLLNDMQRQVSVAISLAEEQKKQLKAVIAEAERKISVAERRFNTLKAENFLGEQSMLLQNQIAAQTVEKTKPKKSKAKTAAEKYKKNSGEEYEEVRHVESGYEPMGLFAGKAEPSLFENLSQAEPPAVPQSAPVPQAAEPVLEQVPAIEKPPLSQPQVIVSQSPIVPKKDFSRQVKELNDLGKNVEEISLETGRSTTEVELMLAMLP